MKIIVFLSLILLSIACDPYGFGFKKNPAYVLDQVLTSIQNQDVESFLENSNQEALCVYGNEAGLKHLRENIAFDVHSVNIKSKILSEGPTKNAEFVGFWAYYRERYQINVSSKDSSVVIGQIVIDCNYGIPDKKNPSLLYDLNKYASDVISHPERVMAMKKKYKTKECKLSKFVPMTFTALPLSTTCKSLAVNL